MPKPERTPVIALPYTSPFAKDKVSLEESHNQAMAELEKKQPAQVASTARRSGARSFEAASPGTTTAIKSFSMPDVTKPPKPSMPAPPDFSTIDTTPETPSIGEYLEMPKKKPPLIPAGNDIYGRPRVRSGFSDPNAYAEYQETGVAPEPTSVIERMFLPTATRDLMSGEKSEEEYLASQFGGEDFRPAWMTAAEVVNDVNTRVRNLRKNLTDDPNDKSDDPTTIYHMRDGQEFTAADRLLYYKMKDGSIIEAGDYEKAITKPFMYQLPDGREVLASDFVAPQGADWELVRPGDPRMAEAQPGPDGNYYYANSLRITPEITIPRADYMRSQVSQYQLPDGRPLDYDAIPLDENEWKSAQYQYRAPDRKTVLVNLEDGSIPEGLIGNMYMDQRESEKPNANIADWFVDKTNLDVANPRAPWQDEAGNNLWDLGRYNPAHSAVDEALPWFIDANLSSVPYYIPKYNIVSGLSAAAPYAVGLDGASYQPIGGLDQVGEGTYAPTQLTNGQVVGGFLAPLMDAIAERFGGVSIGSKKGWFGPGKASMLASSGIREGFEELASSPFNQLEEVGWEDYGKRKYWNEKTQEWEFVENSPSGLLTRPAVSTYLGDFASGVAIGLPLEGGSMILNRNQMNAPTTPEIPGAISRTPQSVTPSINPLDIEEL